MPEFLGNEPKKNPEIIEKDPFLIEEIPYTEDSSPEFNAWLKSRKHLTASRANLTERTRDKVLYSPWHVPCHSLIVKTSDEQYQALHIQPITMGSQLTFEQEQALKLAGQEGGLAIAASGNRGWFGQYDITELKILGVGFERLIKVPTSQWWRLLYDPSMDEIWIDMKVERLLKKISRL